MAARHQSKKRRCADWMRSRACRGSLPAFAWPVTEQLMGTSMSAKRMGTSSCGGAGNIGWSLRSGGTGGALASASGARERRISLAAAGRGSCASGAVGGWCLLAVRPHGPLDA